ncbi:MAG TPA: hypothetical protein P5084_13790 [Paludibacter sp.]|nr:hypothetical protein [Paludibacter sp.]
MKNWGIKYWLLVFIQIFVSELKAENDSINVHLNGQVVVWTTSQFENPMMIQPGGRFVPSLTGKWNLNENTFFDFETSLNINGNVTFENYKYNALDGQIKPYRVWARLATEKLELRAGLQKINFGQAKMFRPLMWFDGMDVRDPLQLTDGVYGILGKYFFENNANIWAWGLIGNKNRKGWEFNATEQWKPETGGRVELPLFNGEIGLSTNYRKVHAINLLSSKWNDYQLLNESRIGLDGKWDIGAGIWFESSTTITEQNNIMISRFQDMWNVGVDYTFPVGSGLGATVEYLRFHAGDRFLIEGMTLNLLGSMFTYPLSIMDNISLMLFYVPGQNMLFNYASWSRTYDKWSIYAIGFINPANAQMITFQANSKNLFSGKGVQLMVSYNF